MTSTITALRVRRMSIPLHTPFVTALRRTTTIETLVLELEDSDGAVGWGEAPQVWQVTGDSVAGSEACLEGPMSEALLGRPATVGDTAALVQRVVVGNRAAKMAADVALHDLEARRAGAAEPVRLRTDVTLAAGDADGLAAAARARVADGFGVLKLKVGTDAATDVARVRAVRDAVGPEIGLRLDANQGWDARSAVEVIRALEDAGCGVELVEQPVRAADVPGLAWVRAHVATPVMADESVFGLEDLVEVIRHDAADLVNLKLAKTGGLTPALEMARVAHLHGIGVCVGSMMESHIGIGAAALLAAREADVVPDLDAAWWAERSPYAGGVSYEGDHVVWAPVEGVTQ